MLFNAVRKRTCLFQIFWDYPLKKLEWCYEQTKPSDVLDRNFVISELRKNKRFLPSPSHQSTLFSTSTLPHVFLCVRAERKDSASLCPPWEACSYLHNTHLKHCFSPHQCHAVPPPKLGVSTCSVTQLTIWSSLTQELSFYLHL